MRYGVEHNLHGQTVTPDETYVRQRDDGWYAFIVVGRLVFKHPEAFADEAAAQAFADRTQREGATIDG